MRYFKSILLILVIAFFTSSCVKFDDKVYTDVDEMVKEAKTNIKTMSMDEFKSLFDHPDHIQIIDCREDYDYILGHFPGAIHIPRGLLEFSSKISNRRLTTLVIGNESGSGALAVQTLKKMKYFDVHMLDFSWFDWETKYPDLIEQGMGETKKEEPVKKASSGGCGG